MRNENTTDISICQAGNGFLGGRIKKWLILIKRRGTADDAAEQQRYNWHIRRDLYPMMYQNGGRYKNSKPIQYALAGVLAIELPQDDFQKFPT